MIERLKTNGKKWGGILAALILAGGLAAAGSSRNPAQDQTAGQIEPFYLRLLRSGENAYIAGNFREAAQDFKVAVFGLYPDRRILARAQVYLGLSLVKTGDSSSGRELIEKALSAIGGSDHYETLGLGPAAASDLAALIKKWNLSPTPAAAKTVESPVPLPSRPAETPPATIAAPATKPAAEEASTSSSDRIGELKEVLAVDPRNATAYAELAELELRAGDAAAAKSTLKSMIRENPAEVEGYLSLGRICYREKIYKEADTHLEKFLDLVRVTGLSQNKIAEARALRLLAASLRDDSRKLRKFLAEYRDSFEGEAIDSLPLFPEDKARLRSILQTGK